MPGFVKFRTGYYNQGYSMNAAYSSIANSFSFIATNGQFPATYANMYQEFRMSKVTIHWEPGYTVSLPSTTQDSFPVHFYCSTI
jgi:hypothetical protein